MILVFLTLVLCLVKIITLVIRTIYYVASFQILLVFHCPPIIKEFSPLFLYAIRIHVKPTFLFFHQPPYSRVVSKLKATRNFVDIYIFY